MDASIHTSMHVNLSQLKPSNDSRRSIVSQSRSENWPEVVSSLSKPRPLFSDQNRPKLKSLQSHWTYSRASHAPHGPGPKLLEVRASHAPHGPTCRPQRRGRVMHHMARPVINKTKMKMLNPAEDSYTEAINDSQHKTVTASAAKYSGRVARAANTDGKRGLTRSKGKQGSGN